jgi:fructoselysine-6-P-deglycase FrlB-like protein
MTNSNGFKKPTLIMATGGSKAAAYYLQMVLESKGTITEVIEPRDYSYKTSINNFDRLIALSKNGKTNGIQEALHLFKGEKYLFTSDYVLSDNNYKKSKYFGENEKSMITNIYWANRYYADREKSFVSLVSTLGPMIIFLELACYEGKELCSKELRGINNKLKTLIKKSKNKISSLDFDFFDTNIIQIMSGYDTRASATILESNMTECGAYPTIIHDKGSYCHGRSNLLFQNPDSSLIYLLHEKKELDETLLEILRKEYQNVFLFHTSNFEGNIFWKEFYLSLQMFYLSQKLASDKQIDLTQPEYNPNVVKKLYNYKGGM